MQTNEEIASRILLDAASFFKNLAEENEPIREQMNENAAVYEQMSQLLANDPDGAINDKSHREMSSELLMQAANYFRALADKYEPIREQMVSNADAFEEIGKRLQNSH